VRLRGFGVAGSRGASLHDDAGRAQHPATPQPRNLVTILSAIASALALYVIAPPTTPIDRALPLIGVLVVFLAFLARSSHFAPAVEIAVPLLVVAAFAIPDERSRLLAYGVITASAFALALAIAPRTFPVQAGITLAAIVVLRWIPSPEVWREVVVAAGAVAIVWAAASPVSAIAIALLLPTHPGKLLLIPFLATFGVRWLSHRFPTVAKPAAVLPTPTLFALLLLWPWSGLVARGLPPFLRAEQPNNPRVIGRGLRASESLDLPVNARNGVVVTMSGANVARFRRGRVVATINGRPVTIGDIADFGFMRREQWFASRNPAPRVPVDDIRGYGIAAFLYGAGRVRIDGAVAALRITAAPDLPPDALVEIESVEWK